MPTSGSTLGRRLAELAQQGDTDGFESTWLQALEDAPEDVEGLLAGIEALQSRGDTGRSGLYLGMLVPILMERGLDREALRVLHKMVEFSPRESGLREQLLATYRRLHAGNPHLEKLIARSGLEEERDLKAAVDRLEAYLSFQPGSYVHHPAGWGTGRITAVDHDRVAIVIDFDGKPGHELPMDMARKVTEPVAPDDIRAMKLDRMDEVQRLLVEDRVELVRAALRSRRGKASLREIRDRLTGPIMDPKNWSRWWQKARREVKQAPDVTITPGSNPTLELARSSDSYSEACLRDLRSVKGDARRVRYLRDLLKEAAQHEGGEEAVGAVIRALAGPDEDGTGLDLGPRISLAFLVEEARQAWPGIRAPEALKPERVAADHHQVVACLHEIPITAHRVQALRVLRRSGDQEWPELYRRVILVGEPETAEYCVSELLRHDREDMVREVVRTITERYREYPAAFAWYLKADRSGRLPAVVPRLPVTSLLEKAVILHNALEVPSRQGRDTEEAQRISRRLAAAIQAGQFSLVKEAFQEAQEAEGRNLARLLRNNRSLKRELRDKVLAHMFRVRPELARSEPRAAGERAASEAGDEDTGVLYVTQEAVARKRREYEELVNELIPANAAEIGRAASHGDLSENAEWAAAVEKQGHLTRQSRELATELERARVIDASFQDGRTVCLGSRVTLADESGETRAYTILGPWDADAHRGIISYLSPLGRSLMGRAPGEHFDLELPGETRTFQVRALEDGLQWLGSLQKQADV